MARNQEKANVRRVSHALSPFFLARSSSSAFFFLRMIFRAMQRILCFTNWKRFVSFTCLFNRSMIEKRKNACARVCVCVRESRFCSSQRLRAMFTRRDRFFFLRVCLSLEIERVKD